MTKLGEYVLSGQEINSNVVRSIDSVEGGGGSSDFSTAEVTVVDSTNPNYKSPGYPLDMPIIGIRENRLDKSITFNAEGSIAHVVLYNGVQSMEVSGIDFEALLDVEGNATVEPNPSDPRKYLLTITGNCTLIVGLSK